MAIHTCLAPLFGSKLYSDLTVQCGSQKFHLQKAIVCSQSAFFANMCRIGRKDTKGSVLCVQDKDPIIFKMLLEFLYKGYYTDNVHPNVEGEKDEEDRDCDGDGDEGYNEEEDDDTQGKEEMDIGKYDDGNDSDEEDDDEMDLVSDADTGPWARHPTTNEVDAFLRGHDDGEADRYGNEEIRGAGNRLNSYPIDLITPLRLYTMAQKYSIPLLKAQALREFVRTAELHWSSYDQFPNVVVELLRCTARRDPLRDFVARLVVAQYSVDPDVRTKFRPLLESYAEFSADLLDKMVDLLEASK